MVTDSSILAWKIPFTEEPGGLQFMGSQRVKQCWVNQHTYTQIFHGRMQYVVTKNQVIEKYF